MFYSNRYNNSGLASPIVQTYRLGIFQIDRLYDSLQTVGTHSLVFLVLEEQCSVLASQISYQDNTSSKMFTV